MANSYPWLCNWLEFQRDPGGSYTVYDRLNGAEYCMGRRLAWFARRLDGKTDPYSLALPEDSVDRMLDALEREQLLRYGRLLHPEEGSPMYSLVILRRYTRQSPVPVLFNYLLLLSWLPVLWWGAVCFFREAPGLGGGSMLWGQVLGMLLGLSLHELAHGAAALCYGGRVFEAGVMLSLLSPGAYVLADHANVQGRLRRAQISAAGAEMNLLLTGFALWLCCHFPDLGGFWFGFGLSNFLLGLSNLAFVDGLDGMAVLRELLDIPDLSQRAKEVVKDKQLRRRLRQSGIQGLVELMNCWIITAGQWIWPLVWLIYLLEVIRWVL